MFINDGYITAAFVHRVTLMSKDFVLVSMLRNKFDKMLEPIPSQDTKAFSILNIPPAREPKKKSSMKVEDMKIEDVTHMYPTRKSSEVQEDLKKSKEEEEGRRLQSETRILESLLEILQENNSNLSRRSLVRLWRMFLLHGRRRKREGDCNQKTRDLGVST